MRAFSDRPDWRYKRAKASAHGDTSAAKVSALGLSIDINPATIVWFGPIVALLLLVSLKVEADSLRIARAVALDEATDLSLRIKISPWVYLLFAAPAVTAAYLSMQFFGELFPGDKCDQWNWIRQFTDITYWRGSPSIYCLGDLTKGTPWVYPPIQSYVYVICVVACGYLTYAISRDWSKSRGGRSPSSSN